MRSTIVQLDQHLKHSNSGCANRLEPVVARDRSEPAATSAICPASPTCLVARLQDHLVRDINAGRFTHDGSLVLVTHGLALRIFLMRWFHWTVEQFLQVYNPPNAEVGVRLISLGFDTAQRGTAVNLLLRIALGSQAQSPP